MVRGHVRYHEAATLGSNCRGDDKPLLLRLPKSKDGSSGGRDCERRGEGDGRYHIGYTGEGEEVASGMSLLVLLELE